MIPKRITKKKIEKIQLNYKLLLDRKNVKKVGIHEQITNEPQ